MDMYPACFLKEESGYTVVFPDLDDLATCGDSLEEAMEMAVDCLAGYLHTCRMDGDEIPEPSPLGSISLEAEAEDIGACIEGSFVNIVSVDVESYAREHFERAVKKTLSIPEWLNRAALEKGINFSQTLQEALKEKLKQIS